MESSQSTTPPSQSWSYEGSTGPNQWSTLHPDYGICSTGTRQSPIALSATDQTATTSQPMTLNYGPELCVVRDTGTAIQVDYPAPDAGASAAKSVGGETYDLVQFHFHTPSEHTFNGKSFALELHLVHQHRSTGALAVVGVFVEPGPSNPTLERVFSSIDNDQPVLLDASHLLPADRSAFLYDGSLTTPPCSEGVFWRVLEHPITMAPEDVAAYGRWHPNSRRPVQPRNDRPVLYHS